MIDIKTLRNFRIRQWLAKNHNLISVLVFGPLCLTVLIVSGTTFLADHDSPFVMRQLVSYMALIPAVISLFGLWVIERLFYISINVEQ